MEVAKEKDINIIDEIEHVNYTRKILELRANLDKRLTDAIEWYGKQIELDKNNDEQIIALQKIQNTELEYAERRTKIIKDYLDKVSKLTPDLIADKSDAIYSKARYNGDVGKYDKIHVGLTYYLKLNDTGLMEIFDDPEFKKFILKTEYVPNEWIRAVVDII